ncbi:uncharacterized protein CLUP02_03427 [Colletotrichum lupini]|uniref:Uncharacterized protein n=1 Tax=Colletotrichum lupini TaxID=145971 RepID=A0A9Q8SIJ9_9PEZI|nr:uncharacterized protein CLUP02_03427 [Colletotrichum lupini]KAK1721770.1 hypothetical protein BDP67DRAFT_498528 [Colletotrichum lupini]UQC77954.1 hypothetical protein CLUP02_03427 [Colletotrichum lupini]
MLSCLAQPYLWFLCTCYYYCLGSVYSCRWCSTGRYRRALTSGPFDPKARFCLSVQPKVP